MHLNDRCVEYNAFIGAVVLGIYSVTRLEECFHHVNELVLPTFILFKLRIILFCFLLVLLFLHCSYIWEWKVHKIKISNLCVIIHWNLLLRLKNIHNISIYFIIISCSVTSCWLYTRFTDTTVRRVSQERHFE